MIVKVQLSQATTHETRRALIYDQSRRVNWEGPASKELCELMGNVPKAFFRANLVGSEIEIGARAPWQEW